MKKFEIEMDIHFTKTLHIEAPNEDAATVLAETMLLCTDALPLTDADMVGLITTATELEKKPARKHSPIDDEDDDEDDDELYEVVCPCCGDTICLNEGMLEEGSMNCPGCNELLEFDFDEEDEEAGE